MKIGLGIGIPNSRVSTGGATPEFPSEISGLVLRLESDTGTSATSWADQSSAGNDADGTGHMPTLLSDQINGLPAFDFNGSSTYMTTGNALGITSYPFTFFVVFSAGVADGIIVSLNQNDSAGDYQVIGAFPSVNQLRASSRRSPDTPDQAVISLTSSDFVIASARFVGNSERYIRLNGASSVNTDSTSFAPLINEFAIGRLRFVDSPFFFTGRIAAVLAYNRDLSGGEIGQVETYLSAKYGITLA